MWLHSAVSFADWGQAVHKSLFPLYCLAPALLLLAVALDARPASADVERVGVNAAVNTNANGTPPGGTMRTLVLGEDIVHNERITTDANGQTQIMFLDGSSVSIGPNSDMTIDEFVYDPKTGTGKMSLTDLQGAMRFVGGKLSKQEDAVSVHLGTATIGVRGGVFLASAKPGGASNVIFVFGKAVNVTGASGCSQQLYRPGFQVSIAKPGDCPSNPQAATLGTMSAILLALDGRTGGNGGIANIPNDAVVPTNIAGAPGTGIQPPPSPGTSPPPPTTSPPQVQTQQIQSVSNPPPQTPQQTQPPSNNFPNTTGISGAIVYTNGDPTQQVSQLHSSAITVQPQQPVTLPYSNASVQNGVLVVTIGQQSGSIPLVKGSGTVNGNATYSPVGPLEGTTFVTPDNTFFYADLVPTNSPNSSVFVYGGTPVNPTAYQPTGSPQLLAFQLHPDAVLQNSIPFVSNVPAGLASNAVVSPLYIEVSPTTGFTVPPNDAAYPKVLQASLAFSGTGRSQQSIIEVADGNAFSDILNPGQTTAEPLLNGTIRGVYSPGNGNAPTLINSGFLTETDGINNSFYGNNSISGFVLDSNNCCSSQGQIPASVSATNPLTGQTTNYVFNQPATAITPPTAANAPQTTQALTGFFGGIMNRYANGHEVLSYAVTGATVIVTDPSELQLAAVFAGSDPFTKRRSHVSAFELNFGNLSLGDTAARQGYINNNYFAADENVFGTQQINNHTSAAIGNAQLYLLNQNVVAGAIDPLLPNGVSVCQCQYLQWGYWGGELTLSHNGYTFEDVGAINTWVAGIPTPVNQLPTMGYGSYSGAAIGTVNSNGATYVAAGGFGLTYNFGNNSGSFSISNFDNHSLSGTVNGASGIYAGAISGSGTHGSVNGMFYGPGAAETGGNFAFQSLHGLSYTASGIFAGALSGPIH